MNNMNQKCQLLTMMGLKLKYGVKQLNIDLNEKNIKH